MSTVRVLVGRRKGAFVITSDGARRDWRVDGPLLGGWHVMHVHGSPADPDRLYASQWTDWHGQVIQRSDDGGRTWAPVGNGFACDGGTTWSELAGLRTHATGNTWAPVAGGLCLHTIIIDPADPRRMFVAISAAGAFRSEDGGATWQLATRGLRSEFLPDPGLVEARWSE